MEFLDMLMKENFHGKINRKGHNMAESVVTIEEIEAGIVKVTMKDTVNKNTFSDELVSDLKKAFKIIDSNSKYKVVILTGYDNYFSSGGTKEGLLAIYEGKQKFTKLDIYNLPLDCRIPVISAMQGHGIGGGFIMGLFADFVILSRESVYTANFMKYGFTPGTGATYILEKKLGISLAEEMLLSANNYRGAELEKKGIAFPVLPRADVGDYALELAKQVAEKPRMSLITLKDHLVRKMREELPEVIKQEVIMHEKTFFQEDVKERINELFGK